LAGAIERQVKVRPKLIESRGGVFDVKVGGKLIFSKKATGRFPEEKEILDALLR
jgi:selenoprotein W-related protein